MAASRPNSMPPANGIFKHNCVPFQSRVTA